MARYIDADAYEHAVQGNPYVSDSMKTYVRCSIQSQPTIEAVPKEKILLFLNIANEELSKAHADQSMNGIVTWSASVTTLEGLLKEYDTADTDIVPVIRCRDCKYNSNTEGNYVNCDIIPQMFGKTPDDNYCSRAEPKDTTEEVRKQLKDMEQRREMDRKK